MCGDIVKTNCVLCIKYLLCHVTYMYILYNTLTLYISTGTTVPLGLFNKKSTCMVKYGFI